MTYLQCLNEKTNFEETKHILETKKLCIKEYGNLFIVKYDKSVCDMNDSDVVNNIIKFKPKGTLH